MRLWTDRVLPRIVDRVCATDHLAELRQRACAGLHGDVVEVGFGSGLNAAWYPTDVTSVAAVEPSEVAWRLAGPRIQQAGTPITRAGLDGQRLDLPDSAYDCALSSFSLCTIPDLGAALAELRRVLRPGGALHFLEHGRAPDARVRRWQQRIEPVHARLAGGCHLTRAIDEVVGGSGFVVEEIDRFYDPGPKVTGYIYLGRARRP